MNCWQELHDPIGGSAFSGILSTYTSPVDGQQDEDWESQVPPPVSKDQIYDHLMNLHVYNSMAHDEIYPRVLRELADVVAKLLSIIFGKPQQSGEVPDDWKRGNIAPILTKGVMKDPVNN
ncbi:RNA-directed DNA polymerase from mobile element jockey [Pitangus sulphuratus]|nr:RNA-directed DNA polymerase from mobile element jockey [Pitangus sulphuratus]